MKQVLFAPIAILLLAAGAPALAAVTTANTLPGRFVMDAMLTSWSAPRMAQFLNPYDPDMRAAVSFHMVEASTVSPSPRTYVIGRKTLNETHVLTIDIPPATTATPGVCRARGLYASFHRTQYGYELLAVRPQNPVPNAQVACPIADPIGDLIRNGA